MAFSKMVVVWGLLFSGVACASSTSAPAPPERTSTGDAAAPRLADAAEVLLVVRTADWDAPRGTLAKFRRVSPSTWELDGPSIPIVLGRSGLAWGRGVHGEGKVTSVAGDAAPEKREGDGRSPAGAFWIEQTYGYAATPPNGTRAPYAAMTPTLQCIEDTKSAYYNQVVDRALVTPDWSSTDLLKRNDGLYELIAFVKHNTGPAIPGRGSCILLHVWSGETVPTAGCTSMKRDDLANVVASLAPSKNLLVQLPEPVYAELAPAWGLPAL